MSIPANELAALLLGGAAAAALGAIDDFLDLRARWQLIGQIGLALFAVGAGIVIDYINDPFGPGHHPVRRSARCRASRSSGSSA